MREIKPKHILVPPVLISLVFFLLYFRMQGISGGDLFITAITSITLVAMTLIIGLSTFSWKLKDKLGYILGIVVSFILAFSYNFLLL